MRMLLRGLLHKKNQLFVTVIGLVSLLSACGPGVSDYSEKIWGSYEYVSDSTTRNLIRNVANGSIVIDYCVEKYWSSEQVEMIVALRFPVTHNYVGEGESLVAEITRSTKREIWVVHKDEVLGLSGEVTRQRMSKIMSSFGAPSDFVAKVQSGLSPYYEDREYSGGACLNGL